MAVIGATASRREFTRPSVLAAFGAWIGFLVGPNVMIASTNANFNAVLPDVLHISRTQLGTALAAATWMVAILVPIMGRLMDRIGVRKVLLPGCVLFGITFLLLSRIDSYWMFFALQVPLALAASTHCSVAYAKVIATWFDRNRGKVLGLCVALGAGVGQTTMPKLSHWLIETYGWRGGYIGIALIILVLGLPLIALLVRTPALSRAPAAPAQPGIMVEGSGPTGVDAPADPIDTGAPAVAAFANIGLTRAEALRTRNFYQVFFAIMFASMSLLGTLQNSVSILTERGLSGDLATTLASLSFAGVILGEFSSGVLVDRVNTPRIILPYFISALIGLLIVHTSTDPTLLKIGALMMGLGLGGEVGQNAYLVSRYFGLKSFGAIYGLTFAASNIGIGCGLILVGWVRDTTGSYEPMRYIFGTAMMVSVLCIALLPAFTFAGRRAD